MGVVVLGMRGNFCDCCPLWERLRGLTYTTSKREVSPQGFDKVLPRVCTSVMATTWEPEYIDPLSADIFDSEHKKLRDLIGAQPISQPDAWAGNPDTDKFWAKEK